MYNSVLRCLVLSVAQSLTVSHWADKIRGNKVARTILKTQNEKPNPRKSCLHRSKSSDLTSNCTRSAQSMPSSTVSPVFCQPVSPFDYVCRLLPNHHSGRRRVPRDDLGHDGGVGHPQPGHPVHPQLWVHDGQGVGGRPHATRPHVMVVLVRYVPGSGTILVKF